MGMWQSSVGRSDEWYTPKYVFDAMGVLFDLDVASPKNFRTEVPASRRLTIDDDGLKSDWEGFVWMNPPFGGRNALIPWLDKFFHHGDGVALTPDRTSAPWWQEANSKSCATLFVCGKIKFIMPCGTQGKSPSNGTTLFASGSRGVKALLNAQENSLGTVMVRT